MGSLDFESIDWVMRTREEKLRSLQVTQEDYLSQCKMTPELNDQITKWRELNMRAVELKRGGNIEGAHDLYCKSFRIEPKYDGGVIWGWVKLFLLSKDWSGAARMLNYCETMQVAWNHLMRNAGNEDYFRQCRAMGVDPRLTFDFDLGEVIRDNCGSALLSKEQTENKFISFGGSPYWKRNYNLTEGEFQEFLAVFSIPTV